VLEDARDVYFDPDTIVNWDAVAPMLILGAASVGLRESGLDEDADDWFRRHELFAEDDERFIYHLVRPGLFIATGVIYAWGIASENEVQYAKASSLMSVMVVTALSVEGMKVIARDERPDDKGNHAWPSGHAASSMAFAVAVDELYGFGYAIPLYALSVTSGIARLDMRDHFVSQVVAGWGIGYIIGRSITEKRLLMIGDFEAYPIIDTARGAYGIGFHNDF
jgi:hypothetical protein